MSEIPTHIRHCIFYELQLGNSASAADRNIINDAKVFGKMFDVFLT